MKKIIPALFVVFVLCSSVYAAPRIIIQGYPTDATFGTISGNVTFTGSITGTSADLSGDIDVDGTTNLDNTDIDGTVSIQPATDSTTAVQVLDADGGTAVVTVDTVDEAMGIAIAPVAGTRLTLPQENDAATPTLAFGGDSGFYEQSNNIVAFSAGGVKLGHFYSGRIEMAGQKAPAMVAETSSATNPGHVFQDDYDTCLLYTSPSPRD